MTNIVWSAVLLEADAPCVTRRTTQILSVFSPEPQDAAATVLKWWLEEDNVDILGTNWDSEAGDATLLNGHVVIHDPAELAGVYEVEVERVIQARGYEADEHHAKEIADLVSRAQEAATP